MGRMKVGPGGRWDEIVDATEALVNEKGFENPSIEDIDEKAGLAKIICHLINDCWAPRKGHSRPSMITY